MSFDLTSHLKKAYFQVPHPYKKSYEGALNLSSNELLHSAIQNLYYGFIDELRPEVLNKYPYHPYGIEKIADFYQLEQKNVLLSPGADNAIQMVINTIVNTKGRMILQTPNYKNYEFYAQTNNISINFLNYCSKVSNDYLIEVKDVIENYPPSTLVLTNPNGFTGHCFTLEEIADIADKCWKNNHLLIIDEAYTAFSNFDHLSLLCRTNNVLIIRSFSKAFGMAGLRLAAVFSTPEITEYLSKWNGINSVTGFSIKFMDYCIRNYSIIQQMHRDIKESRTWLYEWIQKLFSQWKVYNSQGNFLLIDTKSKSNLSEIVNYLNAHKIIVKNFSDTEGLNTCFRITVGEKKIMEPILNVLRNFQTTTFF